MRKWHSPSWHGRTLQDTGTLTYLISGFITCSLKAQVHHGVLQRATHVEFQGKVIDALQTENKILVSHSVCKQETYSREGVTKHPGRTSM